MKTERIRDVDIFRRFIFISALVLLAAAALELFLESDMAQRNRIRERGTVSDRIATLRADIEKEIIENLSLIYGTANFLSVTPDMTQAKFARYARGVFARDTLLKNLAAAPDFIMQFVYPVEGNRKILGVNYRDLPDQWSQVKAARDSDKMVVAGPLELIQGGRGLIGRAPVFTTVGGERRFWGIVSAVIDADRLFQRVNIPELAGLRIALRGVDGKGESGGLVWGDDAVFSALSEPVKTTVHFPSGDWVIAAIPLNGWDSSPPRATELRLILSGFTLIILLMMYRGMRKKHILRQTQASLKDAQAIAHLGNWELDLRTDSFWWSDEVYRIYGVDQEAFEPSMEASLALIHPEDRARVGEIMAQAGENPQPYSLEHRVLRSDGSLVHVLAQGKGEYDQSGTLLKMKGTVLDITERAMAQASLLKEQLTMKAMAEASYDAFIMVNSRGEVMFWSPAAERMFGWSSDEALGGEIHDLIAPGHYHRDAKAGMRQFARTGTGAVMESVMEFESIRKDGSTLPVERSVSAFMIDNEYLAVGILRDITERKRYQEELKRLARTDKMTGIYNRGYFVDLATKELERSRRFSHSLSLIMFDADKFKVVNDTYGHDIGDKVLIAIADTVRSSVREIDIVGRLGGEEFAVLLLDTDIRAAQNVAEKIRLNVQNQVVMADQDTAVRFTISLGIAEFNDRVKDFDALLKQADMALYKAKSNGRNRWEIAS